MHTVSHSLTIPGTHPTSTIIDTATPIKLRRDDCVLSSHGYFKKDLASLRLELNITSDIAGVPPVPIFIIEDDFCTWVDVKQNGITSCPPKHGSAELNYKAFLMQGWIPEVRERVKRGDREELGMSRMAD